MTIINIVLRADQAFIVTDSKVSSGNEIIGYTGKVLTCPYMQVVTAGMGSLALLMQWRRWAYNGQQMEDIGDLVREAPGFLRLFASAISDFPSSMILAVGMRGETCLAYAFASESNFEPQTVPAGSYFNPLIPAGTHAAAGDYTLTIPDNAPAIEVPPTILDTPAAATSAPARMPSFAAEVRKVSVAAHVQSRLNPVGCGGKLIGTWIDGGGIRQAVVGEA